MAVNKKKTFLRVYTRVARVYNHARGKWRIYCAGKWRVYCDNVTHNYPFVLLLFLQSRQFKYFSKKIKYVVEEIINRAKKQNLFHLQI